ncbi:rod shape-determining protein RodA [Deferribacter abyssi]|uniref:rod shape-determining protein RodA n=1 Tax=Deferribacter abyssi TaxID=213806 RepID=UPI003C29DDF4
MFQLNKKHFKYFDYILTLLVVLISIFGVIAIYSASYDLNTNSFKSFYLKQIIWITIGIICYFLFTFINYRFLLKYSHIFYYISLLVLGIVLIKGHIGMGAQRWINIGGFRLQPSEFIKVVWILFLAKKFSTHEIYYFTFLDIFKKVLFLAPIFILIFLQPDLGTALIYVFLWGIALLYCGVRKYTVFVTIILVLISLPIGWSQLKDYQKKRIITFLYPEKDPFGAGYHVIQSKIAIGSGGLKGKGFLKGTQSHLRFLPERHTDFIFSLINEEFGFFGGITVLTFIFFIIFKILYIGLIVKEPGGKIVCLLGASLIFFQTFVNSAMTVGLMPVVGIPMPFVSYGGSSIITFFTLSGIINSISMRRYDIVS